MYQLLGEYECKLDAKARMRMPTPLLRQLGGEEEGHSFVVNRGFEKYLMLYPKPVWDKISAEVNQLNTYNRKNLAFMRYFYRGAQQVDMDKAGRILVPKTLLEYAEADKELILFAYNDRMELWSPEKYNNLLADEPENFQSLAEEVMGKSSISEGKNL